MNGAGATKTGEMPPLYEPKHQGSQARERVLSSDGHAVEAVGLTKRFGHLLAVDGVSFSVRKGEVFGFLGPNGAGKTTTVRMLTTLLAPSDGTALIEGCDILRDPYGAREHIGVVPETSNVYVELSAWDNLMFSAELYGVPRRVRGDRSRDLQENAVSAAGRSDQDRAKNSGSFPSDREGR